MSRANTSIRDFTDYQVYTIIKTYPGLNPYQLVGKCKKEMAAFTWSKRKINRSLSRLMDKGRIRFEESSVTIEVPCKTYFPVIT